MFTLFCQVNYTVLMIIFSSCITYLAYEGIRHSKEETLKGNKFQVILINFYYCLVVFISWFLTVNLINALY